MAYILKNFSLMKKVLLILLLIAISRISSAPNIDFRLKLMKIRSLSELISEKYHEAELTRFINDLGFSESRNNWLSVNQIGCFGEWQFHETTLKFLGYKKITLKKFRENPNIFPPELQLKALKALIKVNLSLLNEYEHFIGDSIRGVRITKSGMIAASHLGGAGSLQKFLDSKGIIDRKDVLGTSISDYLKRFSYYDLN
jgi:hypothetical protein